jgi:capsular polysaccharide biosynthesis protein
MNQLLGQSAPADPDRSGELAPSSTRASSGGQEQAFFHLDLRRSLELHWRLARAVFMGGAVLAVLYLLAQVFVFKSWPTYQSNSIVYVNPTPAKVLEPSQGGSPRWPFDSNTYESYIQQQMMNVSRDDVLVDAVHRISGFQKPGESDQAAAQRLVRRLVVTREQSAYQFSIGARAGDPNMAAQIANAITASYIESASRDERTGDSQRLSMLREERDRIQNGLNADRAEQEELNKQLGVAAVGGAVSDHFDQDISEVHGELVKARTDHDQAESKFASLEAGRGPSSAAIDAEADGMIANDAGLVSMKQALNQRRAVLISQMANLTPVNPQYKQDEVELTRINGTLDAMLKDLRTKAAARIQLQLRADLQRTAGVESQLNGQLRQLVGAAGGATPKLQRSSDLAADVTRLQARFAIVDEQLHNLMLEDSAPASAYQVTPAVAPLIRTKSGVMRNGVMLVFAGLFFGVLAAVVAHRLDSRIYIAADVERVLGFAPMALLPDFNEVSGGVAEEYLLRLASAIEHARKQGGLKSCVFTGTGSKTGVTTLVNRVRAMLEAMGRPTVLVDATGVPPPATTPAGGAQNRGETQGLVPVKRVSRPTALLQQMAEETDTGKQSLVLTDTAPLAVSAETEYLARFVDCAIVVIDSGTTTRAELREAAKTLERLDVGAVGFVLNRIGLAKADPAFRNSVEAVEKHLLAQGNSGARRTEHRRRSTDLRGTDPRSTAAMETPAARTERKMDEFPRSLFEPEVAAAAAAVARFAAHPSSETAVCLSSPMVSVPVAAAARRFTVPMAAPFVSETAKTSLPPAATVPVPTVPAPAAPAPASVLPATKSEAVKSESVLPMPTPPAVEPVAASEPPSVLHLAPEEPAVAAVAPQLEPEPVGEQEPVEQEPIREAETVRKVETISEAELVQEAEPVREAETIGEPEPTREPEPVRSVEAVQPVASPASDLPWWLSEAPHLLTPQRPAVIWEPAKAGTSRMESTPREAAASGLVQQQAAPVAAAQPWEQAPSPVPAAAPAVQAGTMEEPQENLTSRLSGLRSLLFVLGVKESRKGEEQAERSIPERAGSERPSLERLVPERPSPERPSPERPNFQRSISQAPASLSASSAQGASPRLVTATPEVLPPKPVVIDVNKLDESKGESSTRQDRRASFDGIEILPSKRGQYKKI